MAAEMQQFHHATSYTKQTCFSAPTKQPAAAFQLPLEQLSCLWEGGFQQKGGEDSWRWESLQLSQDRESPLNKRATNRLLFLILVQ